MTSERHIRLGWVVLVLLLGLVLGFFIVKPFLGEIFLAGVLAIVAYPLHKKILAFLKRPKLASLLTTTLVLLLVIIPVSFVGTLVVKEVVEFAGSFQTEGQVLGDAIDEVDSFLARTVSAYKEGTLSLEKTKDYIGGGLNWFANNFQGIFANILDWFISIAIMTIALYYLFKDGEKLHDSILYTSPLDDTLDVEIGTEVATIMRAVIAERLLVGVMQGFAAYLGFVFFGVGNALLLATLVTIIAILPLVGTLIVILPIVVYQLIIGLTLPAIGLLLWGIFIVGLVDNVIGPLIIHGRTNLHPFIVLVSILGGIHIFGPVGFVAGPVVIGMIYALFRTLPTIYHESRAKS